MLLILLSVFGGRIYGHFKFDASKTFENIWDRGKLMNKERKKLKVSTTFFVGI